MLTTPDLFAPPAQRHSATSRAAAEGIESASGSLRRQVLEFLRHANVVGGTDEEIQDCLEMNPSTQRPRRIELQRAGLVYDSGTTRKTRSGRLATVWRASL